MLYSQILEKFGLAIVLLSTPWKNCKELEILKIKNKIIIDFRNFIIKFF